MGSTPIRFRTRPFRGFAATGLALYLVCCGLGLSFTSVHPRAPLLRNTHLLQPHLLGCQASSQPIPPEGQPLPAQRVEKLSRLMNKEEDLLEPKVVICGAGPGGLLTSILLSENGINSTILERSPEPDQWNAKSYTIVLQERGQRALERGECLDLVSTAGDVRNFVYFLDGKTGQKKAQKNKIPGIGLTRPLLVGALEKIASDLQKVTIKRGVGVSRVSVDEESGNLRVHSEDNSIISATHVIGADGKWSRVRQSFQTFNSQATLVTCPSFGVGMIAPSIPEGWKTDGTYVITPSLECMFYIIISPLPADQGLSLSMVCYDQTAEKYPWLEPPHDMKPEDYSKGTWDDEYSAPPSYVPSELELSDHLEQLFQEELPALYEALDKSTFKSARVNRRVTWLKNVAQEGKDVTYTAENGRVALLGDAAHAMTPSMGEGANTALESAVKLVDAITSIMKEKGETSCTIDTMSKAFNEYGLSRPKDVQPIQEMSAARNVLNK